MLLQEPMSSSSRWRIPTIESISSASTGFSTRRRAVAAAVELPLAQLADVTVTVRRGALQALMAALFAGGVLVAPILALVAVASYFAPLMTLRALAPAMITVALVWLVVAIVGAHTQAERSAAAPAEVVPAEVAQD